MRVILDTEQGQDTIPVEVDDITAVAFDDIADLEEVAIQDEDDVVCRQAFGQGRETTYVTKQNRRPSWLRRNAPSASATTGW